MAKYKGGYQIISLLGVLVSASLSSTFNAKEMLTKIKGSNLKRIVLTDLVVDGEKKNDIVVQYELDETNKKLTLNGVYGYKIEIDYSESVTSAGITGKVITNKLEFIVDKNNHLRFIEGNLSVSGSLPEGVEITYNKWSLSGTHLMLVLAGNIANETVITSQFIAYGFIPQWIVDKIVPIFRNVIEFKVINLTNDDTSTQTANCYLQKGSTEGNPFIGFYLGAVTLTKDRAFRIQFDLLIDND